MAEATTRFVAVPDPRRFVSENETRFGAQP